MSPLLSVACRARQVDLYLFTLNVLIIGGVQIRLSRNPSRRASTTAGYRMPCQARWVNRQIRSWYCGSSDKRDGLAATAQEGVDAKENRI